MHVDVKKILFVGLLEDKARFFEAAQKAGIVHFINTSPTSYKQIPEEVERVLAAIKVLRSLPVVRQEENYAFEQTNEIVTAILRLRDSIDKKEEQRRILDLEIARVEVFGDFKVEDIAYIESQGSRKVQFYCGPHGVAEEFEGEPNLIYVGTDAGLDYFVAINPLPQQYARLVEMKVEKPLGTLLALRGQVVKDQHDDEAQLKAYARYEDFLHEALKARLNQANLMTAKSYSQEPLSGTIFSAMGWVPANRLADLDKVVTESSIHAEEVMIEADDPIPTHLENEGARRIGEDLVHIYDTPAYTDKDPSLWVLCFFALFFAMIVGDGGYGLVFLGAALFLRTKFSNVRGVGRRVINLTAILAVACILWGVTNASFFGISLSADHPLRSASLLTWLAHKKAAYHVDQQDSVYSFWYEKNPAIDSASALLRTNNEEGLAKFSDQVFLEFVLLLAVVHIIISLIRYLPRNWPAIGWIIFLLGAVLYVPFKFVDAVTVVQYVFGVDVKTSMDVGIVLISAGFCIAVALSLIQNKLLGLVEPMTVVQIFSDVMSYLRLYALGLAGAIVSATLNEMFTAVPLVLGVILIIIGHTLNIVLAIAGGVIHGLRLNFLEWYHYSFVGGGRQFKPLKLLEVAQQPDKS